MTDLESRVAMMKREVDALQLQATEAARPWYRHVPVVLPILVSVAALLFSFGATYFSEKRLDRQEKHAARAELRGMIQRLTELPKETLDANRTYAKDPEGMARISGYLNVERMVLAKQAAELMADLPGDVTATEYYSVASALSWAGYSEQSMELLRKGLDAAGDAPDEVDLLRHYAGQLFAAGDIAGGRERFGEAMSIFRKYPEANEGYVATSHAFTQISWAKAELSQRQCPEAKAHVQQARAWVSRMPSQAYSAQLAVTEESIRSTCDPDAALSSQASTSTSP
jgi:tetratricopeptide (TPR) repeat protein